MIIAIAFFLLLLMVVLSIIVIREMIPKEPGQIESSNEYLPPVLSEGKLGDRCSESFNNCVSPLSCVKGTCIYQKQLPNYSCEKNQCSAPTSQPCLNSRHCISNICSERPGIFTWTDSTWEFVRHLPNDKPFTRFLADGVTMWGINSSGLYFWSVDRWIQALREPILDLDLSPEGQIMGLFGGSSIHVLEKQDDGTVRKKLHLGNLDFQANSFAISPSGKVAYGNNQQVFGSGQRLNGKRLPKWSRKDTLLTVDSLIGRESVELNGKKWPEETSEIVRETKILDYISVKDDLWILLETVKPFSHVDLLRITNGKQFIMPISLNNKARIWADDYRIFVQASGVCL